MADGTQAKLVSPVIDSIISRLTESKIKKQVEDHLYNIAVNENEIDKETIAERFLSWARVEKNLKIVSADVPSRVLPNDRTGIVHDVKVFVKYGPDDKVYDSNKNIRERVARGNAILQLTNKSPRTFCVLQAMKKFTGGLGDDDDRETGDMMVWQKYFTKPIEETDFVVSTCKANGEAAHLSCIEVDGEYVLCGGSKNVHLLFKNKADIDNYVESRYRIATEICHTVMEFLDRLESMQRTELLAFLVASRYTAVFEILSPLHQHVVDLTHLKSPQLKFITWTKCELEASEKLQHLNVVPPHVGIEIARCLGLDPVDYEIMEMKDLEPHIKQIRQGFNTEGAVLYFHDNKGQVIGLLKKKSTWYIICRAIREKVKNAVSSMQRNPNTFSISRSLNQAEKRIKEIQQWLGLDDPTTREWMRLGSACVKWVIHEVEQGTLTKEEVADLFPVYWNRFLSETGNSDKVNVTDNSTDVGACKS